jgi:hypothetical protein
MPWFASLVAGRPRIASALAFGGSTAALTHIAWHADARWSGAIPLITLGAGLAHCVAGAITGPRLLDTSRTRTSARAAVVGAQTSLLALVFFAPGMAIYVSSSNASSTGALAFVGLTLLTGLFAFLAAGWGLLLLSAGVGVGLNWLAIGGPPTAGESFLPP